MTEVFAVIGEDIIVPTSVHLIISCSHLISAVVPFNITWHVNNRVAINDTSSKLIISQDKHQLIIRGTLLSQGGQLGSRGDYVCTVCSNNRTCINRQSHCEVCGKPVLVCWITNFNT